MRRSLLIITAALAVAVSCSSPKVTGYPPADILPGQSDVPGVRAGHFPSTMHAFVWRNWGLVPAGRLAEVLGTSERNVRKVAVSMGLERRPAVDPAWTSSKGYITILRRNWHLLPYDQILMLLGKSQEELEWDLYEDDFLFVKLGRKKPLCEHLVYEKPTKEMRARCREIARIVKEEPLGQEVPRFDFFSGLPVIEAGGTQEEDAGMRMVFSYNAVYGATDTRVFVANIAPQVAVMPNPGIYNGTNYEASVYANEMLEIAWSITDVPADMADNLTLRWTGLPSNATYVEGNSSSAVGKMRLSFNAVGEHVIALTVSDKDRSSSETLTFVYYIETMPCFVVDSAQGSSISVPEKWLNENLGLSVEWCNAHSSLATSLLQTKAANGRRSVVECYVVGVDPEKADEDFKITSFPMKVDGTPDLENIVFDPPETRWNVSGARPVVKGAASLGGEWQTVTEENKAGFRFFKVEVVLP